MAEKKKKNIFGNVQIIWNHSSTLLKVLIIVLIVFSIAALSALNWVRSSIIRQTDEMRQEAAALEERNDKLTERMENAESVQTIKDIAKEELGMVTSDTVLIQPQTSNNGGN